MGASKLLKAIGRYTVPVPTSIVSLATAATTRQRLLLAILVASLAGGWVAYSRWPVPRAHSDIMPVLWGAQDWLAGVNPYITTHPQFPGPLLYPFTAVLLFLPVANWPPLLVNVAWVSLGAGLLLWAVTKERIFTTKLAMLVSAPFLQAVNTSQWTPLLTAATLLPWAGFVFACKPTTALWLFAYAPHRRHLLTCVGALLISLVVWPAWPWAWRGTFVQAAYTVSPLTLFGGPMLLVALLRWRRPEARLLVAMACVPHTTMSYETLPLFLVARTWLQTGVLWAGGFFALLLHLEPNGESPSEWITATGTAHVWCVYFPALVMILRRPNESQ